MLTVTIHHVTSPSPVLLMEQTLFQLDALGISAVVLAPKLSLLVRGESSVLDSRSSQTSSIALVQVSRLAASFWILAFSTAWLTFVTSFVYSGTRKLWEPQKTMKQTELYSEMEALFSDWRSVGSPGPCPRRRNSRQPRISLICFRQVVAISCTFLTSRELQSTKERSEVMLTAPPAVAKPRPTADASREAPSVAGLRDSPTMAVTAPAAVRVLPLTLAIRDLLRSLLSLRAAL